MKFSVELVHFSSQIETGPFSFPGLFVEMWTNDAGGFPLPKGCYYGPLYSDVAEEGLEVPGGYREFFIEFKPIHPLKDQCAVMTGVWLGMGCCGL